MRIVLVSLGTLGDVHPFIAVGIALAAAGHRVVLAADEVCRGIAERHGMAFRPVRPSGRQVMADSGLDEATSARAVAGDLRFVIDRVVLPYADQTLADLVPAMATADLALCSSFSIMGRIAAEAAGVPVASLLLQPMSLFSADDPPVMPDGSALLRTVRRRLGARAVRPLLALARVATRRQLAPFAAIRRAAGAPPAPGHELIDAPLAPARVFALWSDAFAPLPRDVPDHVRLAGFTFYDAGFANAGPGEDVAGFLARGAAPLVFTLGSLAVHADGGFYAASAAAARTLGRRAVLLVGDGLVDRHRHLAGEDVLVAGYVPHSTLFGSAAAVVHHGGIGTIAQAMRAGIPQLVCPIFGDQFDNAARLRRQGLARVLPHARYTAAAAAEELGRLLSAPDLRACAARVGSIVASEEDGASVVARALIERLPSGACRPRPADPRPAPVGPSGR